MSGGGTWHQSLSCAEPTGPVTLVVERWADARTLEVPFDVSVGLGLR